MKRQPSSPAARLTGQAKTTSGSARSKAVILLAASLLMGAGWHALAVGAPAGMTVSNTAYFEYQPDGFPGGTTATQTSNPVEVQVTQVYNISVTPDGTVAAPGQVVYVDPGATAVVPYTVTNLGNGPDVIRLAALGELGGPLAGTVIFIDTNANGSYDAGEEVSSVLLAADASVTVLVQMLTDANRTTAAGGSSDYVNLEAVSYGPVGAAATGAQDSNNVAALTYNTFINLTLDPDNSVSGITGDTVAVVHLLTNTGNMDINPADLSVTTTPSGVLSSAGAAVRYTVTHQGSGAVSAPEASLASALVSAGALSPGQSYSISVSYVFGAGNNGDPGSNVISVRSTAVSSSGPGGAVTNEMAAPVSDVDSAVLQQGVGQVVKTGVYCGTDASCTSPVPLQASGQVRPGDVVRYTVSVLNTGNASIQMPSIRDSVPASSVFLDVNATTDDNGAQPYGSAPMLYATSATAARTGLTWTPAAPTNLATSTSAASGPFVFVGIDSDVNGTVNALDRLQSGRSVQMELTVRIRPTGGS